ncbi:MAG TPA: class I SAM-dependent methyltransferase [Solirubrobacteraceae bacterium]|nr:class I SAM-dependent methyltransferase [Solirubrobacteraceae bacterium]
MSRAAPGAAWQSEHLAADYVARRRILLPLLDVQEEIVTLLLARHGRPIECFLDLGCGAGAMSELLLDALPGSNGLGLDFSEPMLACATESLARHGERWRALAADLGSPAWSEALPDAPFDAIVSGLAIHHLPPERKPALFAEAFSLLAPGGMFINMDYVAIDGPLRGLFDERMLENAVRAERAAGGTRHEHELDLEDDDDRPDTVEDQLRWLRDAGFAQVETHFKWAEAAVFGGTRPDG